MYQVLLCINEFNEMPWSVEYEYGIIVDAIPMRNSIARSIIGASGGSLDCSADVASISDH
jgi:hypothetical protein